MLRSFKDIVKAAIIFVLQNFYYCIARDVTNVAGKGPFLVIAPHPDDEVLGCGAFVGRACDLGQEVHIVIVVDGEADGMIEIREKEAQRAAAVLGVGLQNVAFLHQPNGNAMSHIDAIEQGLREQIELAQPALIFSPYGIDKHPDHRAVAEAVNRLCIKGVIKCPVYEYPIWFWLRSGIEHLFQPHLWSNMRRVSTFDYVQMKKTSMQAHHTQSPKILGGLSDDLFQPHSFMTQFFTRCELFFEKK